MLEKGTVVFGNWTVEETIGSGAFGTVYKIRREDFGAVYYAAMKVIRIPQNTDERIKLQSEGLNNADISEYYKQIVADFGKEIQLLSSLDGVTNIVDYKDHVIEPNEDFGYTIYIKMQLLTPVSKLLVGSGEDAKFLSVDEIIKLGKDMCSALEVCERKRIIHRDIKIDNIFISDDGDYKLGDFGIARQLEVTQGEMSKKGTLLYMAPEVFKGEKYDRTADIYSLGIVLYRLLNKNRAPFFPEYPLPIKYSDKEHANNRRLNGDVVPPIAGLSDELNAILKKACAYNPRDRYQSAGEFRAALEGVGTETFICGFNEDETIAAVSTAHVMPIVSTPIDSTIADDATVAAIDDGTIADTPKGETAPAFIAKRDLTDSFYENETVTLDSFDNERTTAVNASTHKTHSQPPVIFPTVNSVEASAESPDDKSSKPKLFAIIGGAVALVLVAVIVALLAGGKGDSDDTKSKDKTTKENNQTPIIDVNPSTGDESTDSNLGTTDVDEQNTTAPFGNNPTQAVPDNGVPVTQKPTQGGNNGGSNQPVTQEPTQGSNNVEPSPEFEVDSRTGYITKYNGDSTFVILPDAVNGVKIKGIANKTFMGSSVTTVIVPASCVYIGDSAFQNCTELTNISFSNNNSYVSVGNYAFSGCIKLKNVTLPKCQVIGQCAFENCTSLSSVKIPEGSLEVGNYCFFNCVSLKSVYMPESIAKGKIGKGIYQGCNRTELTVYCPIGSGAEQAAIDAGFNTASIS